MDYGAQADIFNITFVDSRLKKRYCLLCCQCGLYCRNSPDIWCRKKRRAKWINIINHLYAVFLQLHT